MDARNSICVALPVWLQVCCAMVWRESAEHNVAKAPLSEPQSIPMVDV